MRLERADRLEGGKKNGQRFDSFIGTVVFFHDGINIFCDSAVYFKKDNNLEAYGNVIIDDNDSVIVTSGKLFYDGNTRIARLRENVVFEKKGEMILYTEFLNYNRDIELATYYEGGKIVDSTNEITSIKGYYEVRRNLASFKTDVVGKNPDYNLKTDTLQYNTSTKIIYFRDTTYLTDMEGNVFVYKDGIYNTLLERSDFNKGYFESESYFLYGDELRLDDINGLNTARGHVRMISKENDLIVLGDKADYYKNERTVKVFENALVKLAGEDGDTLYISADTLVSIDAELDEDKRILAYHNVKIYQKDLQGLADSLVYFQMDSIITFYFNPVIWSEGNQMTSDTIAIRIANQTISSLHLKSKAFVIARDTLGNFNQIKGRSMDAIFVDDELRTVYVHGNGESIFFMLKEDNSGIMGMNKILCSDMKIIFKDNDIHEAIFYTNPDGSFIPPHELSAADRKLNGFNWYGDKRPSMLDVVPHKYIDPELLIELTPKPDVETQEIPPVKKKKLIKKGRTTGKSGNYE